MRWTPDSLEHVLKPPILPNLLKTMEGRTGLEPAASAVPARNSPRNPLKTRGTDGVSSLSCPL
jgi:hypothetical protein